MQEGRSIEGADPVRKGASGMKLIEGPALGNKGDSDRGVCECMNENGLANVTEFRLFGAKKFTARRYVKKEITYFDLRSDRATGFFAGDDFTAFNANEGAFELISGARCEGEARDRGDGGKGFTAKAEGGDLFDIGFALNLTSCMAFEAEKRLIARHSVAVISDDQPPRTSVFNGHVNPIALCVDGVLE